MKTRKKLNKVRTRRKVRARAGIFGTAERPRLAVHRSNRFIYAQLIDDALSATVAAVSSRGLGDSGKGKKSDGASAAGERLAKIAKEKGISSAVFDRRSYKYHGRVKSLAEGARKGGLKV